MSLAQYQDALAQILTDAAFRAAFLADPAAACAAHGLGPGETASLIEIDRTPMALHADLLVQARVMLALKTLPATAKILGERVIETVAGFGAAHPPVPADEPALVVETLRYAAYLRDGAAARLGLPAFTADVVAYETAVFEHSGNVAAWTAAAAIAQDGGVLPPDERAFASCVPVAGANVRIESFAHDVIRLVEAIQRDEAVDAAAFEAPCTLVFVKTAGRRQVETLRVTPDVRALLELCDGTASGGAVAERLSAQARERGRDGGDMLSTVFRVAESLRRKNVLTYRAGESPAISRTA